ncbi:hypothetical protein ACFLXT_04550 [Chloroflexota bacterium]
MMARLVKSERMNRLIRRDDRVEDMATPTWDLIRDAIEAGKTNEALAFVDYQQRASKVSHDSLVSFVDDMVTYFAQFGDEHLLEAYKKRYTPRAKNHIANFPTAKEYFEYCVDNHRTHGGKLTTKEEPDKYVTICDPCGSGGQLRGTRDMLTFKKAYPWTWSRSGIPCYCAHDCIYNEIIPTEIRGYPLRIHLLGEKSQDPCIHLFYKRPELIPEEYFARIGKTKTIK